jgi:hypothetical protein
MRTFSVGIYDKFYYEAGREHGFNRLLKNSKDACALEAPGRHSRGLVSVGEVFQGAFGPGARKHDGERAAAAHRAADLNAPAVIFHDAARQR